MATDSTNTLPEKHSALHDAAKKLITDAEEAGFYDVIAIVKAAATELNDYRAKEREEAAAKKATFSSAEEAQAALDAKKNDTTAGAANDNPAGSDSVAGADSVAGDTATGGAA